MNDPDDRRLNQRLVEWSGRAVVGLGVAAVILLLFMWLVRWM